MNPYYAAIAFTAPVLVFFPFLIFGFEYKQEQTLKTEKEKSENGKD